MEQLTKDQKDEILKFCKENEDYHFSVIAAHFTKKFAVELDSADVSSIYFASLVGLREQDEDDSLRKSYNEG